MVVARYGRSVRQRRRIVAWLLVGLVLGGAACVTPKSRTQSVSRTPSPSTPRTKPAREEEPSADAYIATESMPGRIHIVQRGDTLWSLAEHYYGSGKHLHKIRLANRNRLTDPEDLPVNMKLIIP